MNTFNENPFAADADDPQLIWEVYGELLDIFFDQNFSAEAVASEMAINKKLINKALHRLIYYKAVTCTGTDHWGVKRYRLNEAFTGH